MNKILLKKYQDYFNELGVKLMTIKNSEDILCLLRKRYVIDCLSKDIITFFELFGIPKELNEANDSFMFFSIAELETIDSPIEFNSNEIMFGSFCIFANLYTFKYNDRNNSNIYFRFVSSPKEPHLIFTNIFDYLSFHFEFQNEYDRFAEYNRRGLL